MIGKVLGKVLIKYKAVLRTRKEEPKETPHPKTGPLSV